MSASTREGDCVDAEGSLEKKPQGGCDKIVDLIIAAVYKKKQEL